MTSSAALVAFGLVLWSLSRPHGLYGVVQYDDGVYLGAAIRLVDGVVPYRDFVFLQPPGIVLLLTPIALASHLVGARDALGYARVLTGLVAGANVILAGRLLRPRGLGAVLGASVSLAVFPAASYADRTLLLEPYLVLFCLAGLNVSLTGGELAKRWRLVAGGACFGFAGSVKAWAVLGLVALLLAALPRGRARDGGMARAVLPLVGGAAIGFGLPCLPFFVMAPASFFHEVVASQLTRTVRAHTPIGIRLSAMVGMRGLAGVRPWRGVAIAIAGVIGAVTVVASLLPSLAGKGGRLEWCALSSLFASVAALLVAPEFFDHYAYFSMAYLALVVGFVAGRATGIVRGRLYPAGTGSTWRGAPLPLRLGRAGVWLVGAGLVVGAGALVRAEARFDATVAARSGDPARSIDAAIAPGTCVVSDAATFLVAANRFTSARAGCPELVDASGTWLSFDPRHPPSAVGARDPALVATWRRWLGRADAVVLSSTADLRVPWTPALRAYFAERFRLVPEPDAFVYTLRRASAG